MIFTARLLTPLAVILFFTACGSVRPPNAEATSQHEAAPSVSLNPETSALQPSLHRLVGRILAIDETRGFAILDLRADAPAAALAPGAELVARTDDLAVTGHLRTSRYARTRTLGTQIVSGHPQPGDEVVFREPKSD